MSRRGRRRHLRRTEAGHGRAVARGGPCDLLRVGRDEDVVEEHRSPGHRRSRRRAADGRRAARRSSPAPAASPTGQERGRPRLARGDRIPAVPSTGDALDRDRGVRRALPGAARPPRPGHPAARPRLPGAPLRGHAAQPALRRPPGVPRPPARAPDRQPHEPPLAADRPGATRRVVRAAARAVCLEALRGAATRNPPASGPTAVATWTSSRSSSCRCCSSGSSRPPSPNGPSGGAGTSSTRTSPRTSTPGSTTRRCTRSRSR